MFGHKYWEKQGCRRSDDKIVAVVTLEVYGKQVKITVEGLHELYAMYTKHPETCVAFNISESTGHYMAKNSKALAKAVMVSKRTVLDCMSRYTDNGTYAFVNVSDIADILYELTSSDNVALARRHAEQQEAIAYAGDIAYKSSWFSLWSGRGYSYYTDPNIMKHRVTSAYTKMANGTPEKPKRKVLR